MKTSNANIAYCINKCKEHLDDVGMLGYACAFNTRALTFAGVDYLQARDRAIVRHGDKDGSGGYSIGPDSKGWESYLSEMRDLDSVEHEVDIVKVPARSLVGSLSGSEILALDFMIDWDGAEAGNGER